MMNEINEGKEQNHPATGCEQVPINLVKSRWTKHKLNKSLEVKIVLLRYNKLRLLF